MNETLIQSSLFIEIFHTTDDFEFWLKLELWPTDGDEDNMGNFLHIFGNLDSYQRHVPSPNSSSLHESCNGPSWRFDICRDSDSS